MKALVTVSHGWYGCESGCCGHYVHVEAPSDVPDAFLPKTSTNTPVRLDSQFFFEHPWEGTKEEFVEELVKMVIDRKGYGFEIISMCNGYEVESVEVCND